MAVQRPLLPPQSGRSKAAAECPSRANRDISQYHIYSITHRRARVLSFAYCLGRWLVRQHTVSSAPLMIRQERTVAETHRQYALATLDSKPLEERRFTVQVYV